MVDREQSAAPAEEMAVDDGPDLVARLQEEWEHYATRFVDVVRARPLAAAAGAMLVGYLAGRLAARRD